MKRRSFFLRVLVMLCLLFIPGIAMAAQTEMKLQYDGSTVLYKDKQIRYQLDEKQINLGKTPGIIINGYSLVSYKDVFEKALGAKCSYDSKADSITISKYNNTVKLILGSRTAYVNGVKKTLFIAPRKIKYMEANTSKIAVPARFVTEALGYNYDWYSASSTVKISSPFQIHFDSKWHLYTGAKGQSANIDGTEIELADNPALILDNTALISAKEVFDSEPINASYQYDSKSKKVTIAKDKTKIIFTLGSKTAMVNGKKFSLPTAPRSIKNNESKKNCVMVPAGFTAKMLGYDYKWDTASQTVVISTKKQIEEKEDSGQSNQGNQNTPSKGEGDSAKAPETLTTIQKWESQETSIMEGYLNLISNLTYSLASNGSVNTNQLTLTGAIPVSSSITVSESSSNTLYVNLPGMQNTLGEILYIPPDNTLVQHLAIMTMPDASTRIEIQKSEACEYYSSISGNNYTIHFGTADALNQPNEPAGQPPSPDTDHSAAAGGYALRIAKPVGISLQQINDSDQYYNKQFTISLPGDQINFLNKNPIEKAKSNIQNVAYALNSSGNTDITVTTTKLQGYKITEEKGYFCIYVDNPHSIYDKIIALDPGHGGNAPGTIASSGVKEKDITLAILYTYAKNYFNSKDSTIKAYWLRTDDSNPDFPERASFAEEVEADIFISLHMNSAIASANGTETYYSTDNNAATASGLSSKLLASHYQNRLPAMLGLEGKRGVKTAGFYVIKQNTVPSILIELGFFTNTSDYSKLVDPAFQDNAAKSIYQLTEELFAQYPPER